MKVGAVNMRLVKLRKKFGRTAGTGAGGSELAEEVEIDELEGGRVKQEEGFIEVKCEGNW
jgi:hypothetical protein